MIQNFVWILTYQEDEYGYHLLGRDRPSDPIVLDESRLWFTKVAFTSEEEAIKARTLALKTMDPYDGITIYKVPSAEEWTGTL